ncbi:DUF418 domain-containing protein [Rhodococcus sp. YH1]|uniref:DUF418 domain-containing protein n=1 Tax=Rhodococcus sp. YH1 TaxID=89066 RepID=UPI0013870879|nr:hypothetical protein [Rhodococcus sp. YH1]
MTATETTTRPGRIVALDVARGIAILGTLGTNIWILTDPAGIVGYLNTLGSEPWPQRILMQLAQGKFLGLLTLMFGIGLAIQAASARRAGRRWPGGYRVRAALLLLDGALHYLLVAEFDILMGYALVSMLVCGLVVASVRARLWVAVAASAAHVLLLTALVAAIAAEPDSGAPTAPATDVFATGSWWDLVVFRAENVGAFRAEVIFVIPMTIAMFLAGAALYEAGIFDPGSRVLRRKLMLLGAVAAPVDAVVGLCGGEAGVLVARYGVAPFVAVGLLAWIAQFHATPRRAGVVATGLERIGRTALSCYVAQNVLASALCYGWGLGLAARVDPSLRVPFTVAVYLLVCAVLVVTASWWLRRYRQGPVEWLWRVSYQRLVREPATPS